MVGVTVTCGVGLERVTNGMAQGYFVRRERDAARPYAREG